VGRALLGKIIEAAKRQEYHVMVGGIDGENAASIKLHKQFGFVHAGTIAQSGFKFGRWLDLMFYQLTLSTPVRPVDG
jgi:phosphinothricin acetyltransferase